MATMLYLQSIYQTGAGPQTHPQITSQKTQWEIALLELKKHFSEIPVCAGCIHRALDEDKN